MKNIYILGNKVFISALKEVVIDIFKDSPLVFRDEDKLKSIGNESECYLAIHSETHFVCYMGYNKWADFNGYNLIKSSVLFLKLLEPILERYSKPITIKLNDEYTAQVFKDRVEVGCQKFDFDVINQLAAAVNKQQK